MTIIPNELEDFLFWVKERTELMWSQNSGLPLNEEINWAIGAKWKGLNDQEISEIEKEFDLKFTDDHKLFLKILHSIDKKESIKKYQETINIPIEEQIPFFYNWKRDKEEIKNYLDWPYNTILDDVLSENDVWLKSWGRKPQSLSEREMIFKNWHEQAPKLIPIRGHRFMVSEPFTAGNPVLSVYGADTIVYGSNLRYYLIHELEFHLGLREPEDDDKDCYWKPTIELENIREEDYSIPIDIPYWQELIMGEY